MLFVLCVVSVVSVVSVLGVAYVLPHYAEQAASAEEKVRLRLKLMPKLLHKGLRLRRSAPRRDRKGVTIKNETRSGAAPHRGLFFLPIAQASLARSKRKTRLLYSKRVSFLKWS